jgi:hypothetical protein
VSGTSRSGLVCGGGFSTRSSFAVTRKTSCVFGSSAMVGAPSSVVTFLTTLNFSGEPWGITVNVPSILKRKHIGFQDQTVWHPRLARSATSRSLCLYSHCCVHYSRAFRITVHSEDTLRRRIVYFAVGAWVRWRAPGHFQRPAAPFWEAEWGIHCARKECSARLCGPDRLPESVPPAPRRR